MRLKSFYLLAATVLLSGCANEGVVIEKRAVDSPFTYSLGMDASFKLILRDQQGNVRSQLVTPDVFNRYEVGDYFNDQQPGPTHRETTTTDTSKEVQPVVHLRKTHHHPRHRTAQRKKKHHSRAVAKHRKATPASSDVTLRSPTPSPQGLDVTP